MFVGLKKKEIDNILGIFGQDFLTEKGYNQCFLQAYNANKKNSPKLYLVSFQFIIVFEKLINEYYDSDIKKIYALTDVALQSIIEECKNVNTEKAKLLADKTLDKQHYFSLILNTVKQYCELFSNERNYFACSTFDELVEHYLNYICGTTILTKKKKKRPFPMFNDVVGLDKAKSVILERVIKPNKHRDVYEKYDVKVGGGILLFGLPGTGKTMFAKAVANEIDGHYISIKSSDLKSKWYGETEGKVKELFDEARRYPVSVLFFDEFEAIGVSRDKQGSEITASSIVPELLAQMQGFNENENIILVIAATNRPWDIDSALLRPGRLDALVYVDLPNLEARTLMLTNYLNKIQMEQDLVEYLAKYTNGYNGSDIKSFCDSLIRVVINKEVEGIKDYEVTFNDCVTILKGVKTSVVKTDIRKMQQFIESNAD